MGQPAAIGKTFLQTTSDPIGAAVLQGLPKLHQVIRHHPIIAVDKGDIGTARGFKPGVACRRKAAIFL